jgi:hypothetical protein
MNVTILVEKGYANVDEQGHADKASKQTSQEERPADDLGDADKWRHELWQRNANLRKTAHSQVRVIEPEPGRTGREGDPLALRE